ncbi:MAG: hypothetical protein OQK48_07875 [Sulfurimonas sp.]|uniref:hypothetical protein n=1 Tax=Sulfurimonas sp. TaxID=2022749 RepID=UPI00262DC970|nr:hypothetical protein [Sulfurimonas sp.]MCW8895188.1 hypothetical protein [Sulfurimonas sp.]MCW8954851.1 hypothetical protein [Sulfurimonas sp.]MCW9068446.1 hypothetical protein [Sulfurimonas sp.]
MKYLIILLSSISFLNASMLLDKDTPTCIENFYYQNGRIYYQSSDTLNWSSTSENSVVEHIHPNYIYDSVNDTCSPNLSYILGMDIKDFNFLLGFIGVIFGGIFMFFIVHAFINVGGKR